MAFVTLAATSSVGADANPVVRKAVTTASAGPFLVAAMRLCRLPSGRRTANAAQRSPCPLDRHRGADWRRRFPHHILDSPQRDRGLQRVWLRVLPSHRGSHHVDNRDERRQIPRSGDLSPPMRSSGRHCRLTRRQARPRLSALWVARRRVRDSRVAVRCGASAGGRSAAQCRRSRAP